MESLVLHTNTRKLITETLSGNLHALLVSGANGIGKQSIASEIIANAMRVKPDKLASHQYFYEISASSDKGTISIDDVRKLRALAKLKVVGDSGINRAFLINRGETMTIEAQNALLKLLEESPDDTLIIICASSPTNLLPTIVSRTKIIPVTRPDIESLTMYFTNLGFDPKTVTAAYHLSGGLPGLMSDILNNNDESGLAASIMDAKRFLSGTIYDRLLMVDQLTKKDGEIATLFLALERLIKTALDMAVMNKKVAGIKKLADSLKIIMLASEKLKTNPNKKLVLTDLAINL